MAAAPAPPALLAALLLALAPRSAPALELLGAQPTVYAGPPGSYFGFALDFHADEGSVAVGAPRANTSQPGVAEPGAVFLCSWPPGETPCRLVPIDTEGAESRPSRQLRTYKSHQWLGASVTSWDGKLVVGAGGQAFRTPTGACFVGGAGRPFARYAPCRDDRLADTYRHMQYGEPHDKRYCELGFSSTQLVIYAPWHQRHLAPTVPCPCSACCTLPCCTITLQHPAPQCPGHPLHPIPLHHYPIAPTHHSHHSQCWSQCHPVPQSAQCPRRPTVLLRIPPFQVASYFGHTVAVADVDGDGRDDVLVGAPLFLARRADGTRHELGRLYLYLRRGAQPYARPWQTLTGPDPYGRFGSAIASLGDLDQDGHADVAVGAPFGGDGGSGCVFIFRGQSEGLEQAPSQRLESPFAGPAAFGFALRGASDLDGNGYPDLLVGAFGADRVAVYRGQPVAVLRARLTLPDGLNPEKQECSVPGSDTRLNCFPVLLCVSVSGQHIPQSIRLRAELQLDRLKQRLARRVFLWPGGQSWWLQELALAPGRPLCHNLTAYLRDEAEFKDKLSPIAVSLNVTLAAPPDPGALGLLLYGDTLVQEQTRILLDCGEDNVCIPDLRLAADTPGTRLLIGADNVVRLRANASNGGEGAFEAELRVQLPPGAHFQRATSDEKLSCNPRKENRSHVVLCELGNPMKAAPSQIAVVMELSVSGLEDAGDTVAFQLQLRSKNSHSPNSAVCEVKVPVEAQAAMELRGMSLPATVVLPAAWQALEGSRRPEDHGLKVEHVYQLHNKGPGTVSGVALRLAVPSHLRGSLVFYLLDLGTEGGLNCTEPPGLNPMQVGRGTVAGTRAWLPLARAASTSPSPRCVLQNCSAEPCESIVCRVQSLPKGQRALVSVHALLWMDTLYQVLRLPGPEASPAVSP
uniref:Integrin subunit alpha 2b n=1 Tax=Nothoprocta perdicaria TaxID=30464 RepID=A0A8C7EG73_NOTPE